MTCGRPGGGWCGRRTTERQRIERNLHDGAQQQLVALTVQLSLLEDSAGDAGEVRQLTRPAADRAARGGR